MSIDANTIAPLNLANGLPVAPASPSAPPAITTLPLASIDVSGRSRKELGNVQALATSIGRIGLLHPPVVTPDGKLVVGRRRIEAAKKLGWTETPVRVVANLDDLTLLLEAERDENTCREGLVPEEAVHLAQRFREVAERLAKVAHANGSSRGGKAPHNGKAGESFPTLQRDESKRTRAVAASAVGMSDRTLEKAEAVVQSGDRTLVDEMNASGKIDRAFKRLRMNQQRERDIETASKLTTDCGILAGDFRQLGQQIGDVTAGMIFADPPYCEDSLDAYRDLGTFAARVLRPGGWCLAYCGQMHLPRALNALAESGLEYGWTFAIQHSAGDTLIRKFALFNGWKPLVGFYKPPSAVTWTPFRDVVSGGREKDRHEWQQAESEAAHFIEKMTVPGELVVDPFCGSGTSLAAAKRLGRKWLGCEIDPGHVAAARARLAAIDVANAEAPAA